MHGPRAARAPVVRRRFSSWCPIVPAFPAGSHVVAVLALLAGMLPAAVAAATTRVTVRQPSRRAAKAVFFAADGLRQDLVEKYAAQGALPTMRQLPRRRGRRPPATAC